MIVEFVRSSYRGVWKLFPTAPGILTKGRYVRAPEGTLHCPVPHNFWSNNWVDNLYDPPDPPVLGDVTPRRRPWDNGASLVDYPPAELVGSGDCISKGEEVYPPIATRSIIGGYDSRCWTTKGLTIPDQAPWLDYDPTSIQQTGLDQPILGWNDLSGYGNNATPASPNNIPTFTFFDGFPCVVIGDGSTLTIPQVIHFCIEWACFCVVNIQTTVPDFLNSVSICGTGLVLHSMIVIERNLVYIVGDSATWQWSTPDNYNNIHVYATNVCGLSATLWIDGINYGTKTVNNTTNMVVGLIFPFASPLHTNSKLYTSVVLVYPSCLSSSQFNSINSALVTEYIGPVEDDVLPGTVVAFAGPTIPTGYLLCDGSVVSQTTYPDLFTAIGTTWGPATGGNFTLPDFRGRTLIGTGTGGGLSPRVLGGQTGEETHQLVTSELSGHTHGVTDPGHLHYESEGNQFAQSLASGTQSYENTPTPGQAIYPGVGYTQANATGITITNAGGDVPHNNMQPCSFCAYLIKT